MDVELSEVRDFLARHAPFDVLPEEVLDGIPRQCTLRYARRGTVVLEVGQQGKGLYVVRSGAVDVVDESGTLIERVDTGSLPRCTTPASIRTTGSNATTAGSRPDSGRCAG